MTSRNVVMVTDTPFWTRRQDLPQGYPEKEPGVNADAAICGTPEAAFRVAATPEGLLSPAGL